MACILVENLSYKYPTSKEKVLDDVSFGVEQGALCALVGLNGMGKSTLCSALRGFVPQFYKGKIKGSIHVAGYDTLSEDMGQLASKIGYVFQNPFIQISGATDSVFEEIAFGLQNLGWERPAMIERVEQVLELLHIAHLRDRFPTALSGGQLQRVAFASVLAMNPDVFIIDEPTAQLDPQGTEQVFEIIALLKNQGKTIVLVEHKMDLIAKFADQIILLHKGQIKANGSPEQVFMDQNNLQWGLQVPDVVQFSFLMQKKDPKYLCRALNERALLAHLKENR